MRTRPSLLAAAISTESRSLLRTPSLITRRSTTRSMSWRLFLASMISSARSRTSPSTRTRANPSFCSFLSSLANSPFFPRTNGDMTLKRVSGGSSSTQLTMLSMVCD